jgi:hypothetical protein
VLKGFHSGRLDAMFEAYPDAKLIWTHRDPVQVIASRVVMAGELDEGRSGRVDWQETARTYLAQSRASIAAALASPYLDDPDQATEQRRRRSKPGHVDRANQARLGVRAFDALHEQQDGEAGDSDRDPADKGTDERLRDVGQRQHGGVPGEGDHRGSIGRRPRFSHEPW